MPVRCDIDDAGIATVRLANQERRNALDEAMLRALADLWPVLDRDARVRCAVVGGEGDKAFCSGADLGAHLDRLPDVDALVERALLKTALFRKPLIAAIEGACVAGGLELALATDIRIAAEDATFGLPEVRWGIVPSGGGAMKLCDQIGHAKAMDLILSGRLLGAREADAMGLVSRVCDRGQAWPTAMDVARTVATNSPGAMVAAKRCALERRASAYARAEPLERRWVNLVRRSGDPEEGKAAFLDRRQPRFGPAPEELLQP